MFLIRMETLSAVGAVKKTVMVPVRQVTGLLFPPGLSKVDHKFRCFKWVRWRRPRPRPRRRDILVILVVVTTLMGFETRSTAYLIIVGCRMSQIVQHPNFGTLAI